MWVKHLKISLLFAPSELSRRVGKSLRIIQDEGIVRFIYRLCLFFLPHKRRYDSSSESWLIRNADNQCAAENRITSAFIETSDAEYKELSISPKISIIMPVYNVDAVWIVKAIDSVRNQTYENWELCIADDASAKDAIRPLLLAYSQKDPRIRIRFLKENKGIAGASNVAASMADGDYLGFLDHDDELSKDALHETVKQININPDAGLIYSDEDKLDLQGNRIEPFLKPAFSPDLILSQNYICHFLVIRKTLFDSVGGFREGFNGSQDHDLILRILEITDKVIHIPGILYHWRKIPGSTAAVYESKSYAWKTGQRAVEDALNRRKEPAEVLLGYYPGTYRIKRKLLGHPLVSIILPCHRNMERLKRCIHSIVSRTAYGNYEILVVTPPGNYPGDNLQTNDERIRFLEPDVSLSRSLQYNWGVEQSRGEQLVFLSALIQLTRATWIEALLEHSQRSAVGAVGAKLCYPDHFIYHAGIFIGKGARIAYPHQGCYKHDAGYYAMHHVIHNVSALSAALMMVKKTAYRQIGGLDTRNFGYHLYDVDFCLRLRSKGYFNVYTPECEAVYHASGSRGNAPDSDRSDLETSCFESKWKHVLTEMDSLDNPFLIWK